MLTALTRPHYAELMEARVREPESLRRALMERSRRSIPGEDGRLVILAADHTARGIVAAGRDPLAVADRFTLLDRLVRSLALPGVDGVLGSADILEELAWLGALESTLAIATMNRGGILGARWELDDRITAYDVAHVEQYGLDGGKLLLRIEDTDPGVARTLETVAAVTSDLADRRLMCMIEPLPYVKDDTGRAMLDRSIDRMVRVVSIASGIGSSSAYTWLKLPAVDRMDLVAAATSMPIVMLGGDPGDRWEDTFSRWDVAMREPNVRGLVAGRALLYPPDGDVETAVRRAAGLVHGGAR